LSQNRLLIAIFGLSLVLASCSDDEDNGSDPKPDTRDEDTRMEDDTSEEDTTGEPDEDTSDEEDTTTDTTTSDDTMNGEDTTDEETTSDDTSEPTASVEEVECSSVEPDETVSIVDFAYEPSSITVTDGDVIQWTNNGGTAHTVTSGNPDSGATGEWFDSGSIAAGETYCLEFNGADEFPWTVPYFCTFHPDQMSGAEVVVEQ
jgi:plastocyanin